MAKASKPAKAINGPRTIALPAGAHGITVQRDGTSVVLTINATDAAFERAPPSSTGKSRLLARTGAWLAIEVAGHTINIPPLAVSFKG